VLRPTTNAEAAPLSPSLSLTACAKKKVASGWHRPQSAPTTSSWTVAAARVART
jgi:hypothetical protein